MVSAVALSITIPFIKYYKIIMDTKLTEISNTLIKGRITEIKVLTYFLKLGYVISTPEIPCPYDFLLDTGNKILRLQVKTARESEGGFCFNTSSCTHNSNGYIKRTYGNTIDYFCTIYNDQCYLIPVKICGSKEKKLRLEPTKNGQVSNICWAKDYIAEEVLNNI